MADIMMKFCKNLAGPSPAPTYLPTYLPYLWETSRGGVLQLRGNPVHGALSETHVYITALSLRTRTPPGLGLSCPQPDPDHLARWVCFSGLSPPALDVRLIIALQVLHSGWVKVGYYTN